MMTEECVTFSDLLLKYFCTMEIYVTFLKEFYPFQDLYAR